MDVGDVGDVVDLMDVGDVMDTVTSRDGTPIAYRRGGVGRPVVIVTGALNDHTAGAALARELEPDHMVITYDRRARGGSGDTAPYAVEREVEDLAAVLGSAGGSAAVFGYSSGAVLALRAAADGAAITDLALYEPPFSFDDPGRNGSADLPERLADLLEQGRPGDAVALFQTEGLGRSAALVALVRRTSRWPALEAMARSAVYDATLTTTLCVPTPRMAAVTTPTLVLNGAGTWPDLRRAAHTLAGVLSATHRELPDGRNHEIPPASTAAAVREHLARSAPDGTPVGP